ncbi:unnamed protein product, partial [Rotaria sp. Silwood1]
GVNGIKNNVDTSRKIPSLSTTKRPTSMNELIGTIESIPIPTIIEQPIVVFERADSGNGGSDENIRRFDVIFGFIDGSEFLITIFFGND